MELINFNQNRQRSYKRGISLTSNIAKLFEQIIVNRLINHLQFTEAQAGAQPGKNTNQFVSFKICDTTEDSPKSRNICFFNQLRKRFLARSG